MSDKYIAWEFVKGAPYILVPRSYAFDGLHEPLKRLGKHYRNKLEDFDRLVEIENRYVHSGNYTAIVHYLARYVPVK